MAGISRTRSLHTANIDLLAVDMYINFTLLSGMNNLITYQSSLGSGGISSREITFDEPRVRSFRNRSLPEFDEERLAGEADCTLRPRLSTVGGVGGVGGFSKRGAGEAARSFFSFSNSCTRFCKNASSSSKSPIRSISSSIALLVVSALPKRLRNFAFSCSREVFCHLICSNLPFTSSSR